MELNQFTQMIEAITKLHETKLSSKIEELIKANTKTPDLGRTPQLNELFTALSKAQAEFSPIIKSKKGLHSNYADLDDVVRATRPALTKYGLSVLQQIRVHSDGSSIMYTILGHTSGQSIESTIRIIPQKTDPQSLGSQITYLQRYCYVAIVGAKGGEDDDDADRATTEVREEEMAKGFPAYKSEEQLLPEDTISQDQYEELCYELEQYPDMAEGMKKWLNVSSLRDTPRSKYRWAMTQIRDMKKIRNGTK